MKNPIMFAFCLAPLCCFAQKPSLGIERTPLTHPAWITQSNIYEVNVRQYTPEGTFNAFAKHLPRLKNMGVQTIWFMPINPISKTDRKGTLGSYYAVADYTAVNPEFGTLADFQAIVKTIHQMGMKAIIDWVPNHTGADNRWLTSHPNFYVRDSTGKAMMAADWADTRKLNYQDPELRDSMTAAMKYWIKTADIDGFRCDVAGDVPGTFWKNCIAQLRGMKNIFMLAEGDKAFLPENGFDAVYCWPMFAMMKKVAAGERPAFALDSVKSETDREYPLNTIIMYFTSNHDENSWNQSDFGTFPGAKHAPFAVFTQTMANSVPLIYSGQEEPVLRAIQFFEKDPMEFKKLERQKFYKTLLALRKRNVALAEDASFKKADVGNDRALYAYVREKGNRKVFVVLNFSGAAQKVTLKDKSLMGRKFNVFSGKNEMVTYKGFTLKPWGYAVYEY